MRCELWFRGMSIDRCGALSNHLCLAEPSYSRDAQQLGGGRKASGYFASDLKLEQIKSLYATQSFPERDQSQDAKYR